MTRRSNRRAGLVAALGLSAACAHVERSAPLPSDWLRLVEPASPFAALYSLDCCGQRGLLATVRSDAEHLSVSVAVPPGGVALDAWLDAASGSMTRNRGKCRETLPRGRMPISREHTVPLDAALAAVVLSGTLPAGSRAIADAEGWVESTAAGVTFRARVDGPQPHVTRIVSEAGEDGAMTIDLAEHHGRLPGKLEIAAGRDRAVLTLVEWRPAAAPAPPRWLSAPACEGQP